MRICKCGAPLPPRAKKYCTECRHKALNDNALRWRKNNLQKAKNIAREAAQQFRNTDKGKEYIKQYQKDNKERLNEYKRQWRLKRKNNSLS